MSALDNTAAVPTEAREAWLGERLQAHLREGKIVRFHATGASMWPSVRAGAVVQLDPAGLAAARPGELFAYAQGSRVVVHRLLRRDASGWYFRGDALSVTEGPIAAAQLLGRATVLRNPPLTLRWPSRAHLRSALRALRTRLALGRLFR